MVLATSNIKTKRSKLINKTKHLRRSHPLENFPLDILQSTTDTLSPPSPIESSMAHILKEVLVNIFTHLVGLIQTIDCLFYFVNLLAHDLDESSTFVPRKRFFAY